MSVVYHAHENVIVSVRRGEVRCKTRETFYSGGSWVHVFWPVIRRGRLTYAYRAFRPEQVRAAVPARR